jgi:hypothetical protein
MHVGRLDDKISPKKVFQRKYHRGSDIGDRKKTVRKLGLAGGLTYYPYKRIGREGGEEEWEEMEDKDEKNIWKRRRRKRRIRSCDRLVCCDQFAVIRYGLPLSGFEIIRMHGSGTSLS